MRHASLSLNEVLGANGQRGILSINAKGDGTGTVTYKPYGIKRLYTVALEDVARFVQRGGGDERE